MRSAVIFLGLLATVVCYASELEVNYNAFSSISEVIDCESSIISNTSSSDYEQLSDAYASRGESFLISGHYQESLEDFQKSYEYGSHVDESHTSRQLIFRALFGQALAYGYLNHLDKVESTTTYLLEFLQSFECSDCNENSIASGSCLWRIYSQANTCNDVAIYGPDKISIRDCMDYIDNTISLCTILIAKAPAPAQAFLTFTINQLANTARQCCYKGGIWKGCVQKLMNKYHLWNQKWQVFGIPPDPAWDD